MAIKKRFTNFSTILAMMVGGVRGATVFCSLFIVSSCSFIDVRDEVSYGGQNSTVTAAIVDQIQPERTSLDWVLDNLGDPAQITTGQDDAQVYVYRFDEVHKQRTRILFIFSYRLQKTVPRHIYVEIKDKTVQKIWRDTDSADESWIDSDANNTTPGHIAKKTKVLV